MTILPRLNYEKLSSNFAMLCKNQKKDSSHLWGDYMFGKSVSFIIIACESRKDSASMRFHIQ